MVTLKLLHTLSPTIWKIINSDKFFPNQGPQWLSMETIIGTDLYQALTLCVLAGLCVRKYEKHLLPFPGADSPNLFTQIVFICPFLYLSE